MTSMEAFNVLLKIKPQRSSIQLNKNDIVGVVGLVHVGVAHKIGFCIGCIVGGLVLEQINES